MSGSRCAPLNVNKYQGVVDFLQHLLPARTQLQLKNWSLDSANQRLILTVSSVQTIARCPVCEQSTHRVHSRYERTLQDLPCTNYAVTLFLLPRVTNQGYAHQYQASGKGMAQLMWMNYPQPLGFCFQLGWQVRQRELGKIR